MSQQPPSHTPRKPGRPRSERARRAILDAAHDILMDKGFGRLTVEAVAARAGVGKPTIYRSWANAQELAMAALMSRPLPEAEDGRSRSAVADLRAHVAGVVRAFATPRGRQVTLTMAAADDDSEIVKAFRNQVILKCRETGRAILERAADQGEVSVGEAMETVLDTIYGPVFYRLLAGHLPLTEAFAREVVDTVVGGIGKDRR